MYMNRVSGIWILEVRGLSLQYHSISSIVHAY